MARCVILPTLIGIGVTITGCSDKSVSAREVPSRLKRAFLLCRNALFSCCGYVSIRELAIFLRTKACALQLRRFSDNRSAKGRDLAISLRTRACEL
jgi:hypothetical protein